MTNTIEQINMDSKSNLADIIGGYIRFTENKELKGKLVKNVISMSEKICEYCNNKSILEKFIFEFKENLRINYNGDENEYYSDVLHFLENYTINSEFIANYRNSVGDSTKCGLYEFMMKIGDVFDNEVRYSISEERKIQEEHKNSKSAEYDNLEKNLEKVELDEITFSYKKIGEIINNPNFKVRTTTFWWDKYIISNQSKAWRKAGFQVKNFNTKKKCVTFKRLSLVNDELGKDECINIEEIFNDEYSEEEIKVQELYEGAFKTVLVNKYERNIKARRKCIEHYGCRCTICGFDFLKVYGELGRDFIEVHHLTRLSDIKGEYEVDPIKDLITVCSNCHSIIHRQAENLDINVVRQSLNLYK